MAAPTRADGEEEETQKPLPKDLFLRVFLNKHMNACIQQFRPGHKPRDWEDPVVPARQGALFVLEAMVARARGTDSQWAQAASDAAARGDESVLRFLEQHLKLTPDTAAAAFQKAARAGHANVLALLWRHVRPSPGRPYGHLLDAYYDAATNGRLAVMEWIFDLVADDETAKEQVERIEAIVLRANYADDPAMVDWVVAHDAHFISSVTALELTRRGQLLMRQRLHALCPGTRSFQELSVAATIGSLVFVQWLCVAHPISLHQAELAMAAAAQNANWASYDWLAARFPPKTSTVIDAVLAARSVLAVQVLHTQLEGPASYPSQRELQLFYDHVGDDRWGDRGLTRLVEFFARHTAVSEACPGCEQRRRAQAAIASVMETKSNKRRLA